VPTLGRVQSEGRLSAVRGGPLVITSHPTAPVTVRAGSVPEGKVEDFLTRRHVKDTPEEYVRSEVCAGRAGRSGGAIGGKIGRVEIRQQRYVAPCRSGYL